MIRSRSFWTFLGLTALMTACGGASTTIADTDGMAGSGTGGVDGSGGSGTGGVDGTGAVSASCSNGKKNDGETDIDCGGTCAPCDEGLFCRNAADCKSNVCDIKSTTIGVCQLSSCYDGVKNGAETGVDCGGASCATCSIGTTCTTGADCASGICSGNICTVANCGDGVQNASEACDDGGASATCTPLCTLSYCGDGYANAAAGEVCDDATDSNDCDDDCTAPSCGDGHTNYYAGEDCDTDGDSPSCTALCTTSTCGDGYVNSAAGEDCDTAGSTASCDSDCTPPVCGDGVLNVPSGEECDDGNNIDNDGCDAVCDSEGTAHTFTFVDSMVNDVGNLALRDFFTSFTALSSDFILFEINTGAGGINAWCAERADWYATTYVANVNTPSGSASEIPSGSWNKYFRVASGAWSAATTQAYYNYFGFHCGTSQGGWCSEWDTTLNSGNGPTRNAFIPDETAWSGGELYSNGNSSNNAGWTLRIVVAPTRQEACGF